MQENIIQANMRSINKMLFVIWKKVREICKNYIKKIKIKGKYDDLLITLSGGNQQKVAISKWLHAKCRLLIFDEPTRGLDVAAKAQIYDLIKNFAKNGRAAIVISSEVNELVDLSDRIIVMSKGKISSKLQTGEITQNYLLACITKGRNVT
jgi:ABC-type sugar transport system ATPase subunit